MPDTPRRLKTGGDPRTLAEHRLLREELSKLSHPARPDVDWRNVEKLCLSLFELNGVELQTTAWYTLARTRLAGLHGLNEGLAMLEALISYYWGNLWPQPVHARMEIVSSLSQRLQQALRTLTLTWADLSQLYQAEQHLTRMVEVLARLELKHLSQLETLRTLLHNAAVRLENSNGDTAGTASDAGMVLPPGALNNLILPEKEETARWVFVAQPEPAAKVRTEKSLPSPVKPWRSFVGGMLAMLIVMGAAAGGWRLFNRPEPLNDRLNASLAPLAQVLTLEQQQQLKQAGAPANIAARTERQLARLSRLPPDWTFRYARQLVAQAQTFQPADTAVKQLSQQWERQLTAAASTQESLNGWHQGMEQLQQLAQRLNALDERRGKYLTASELKTMVFAIQQSLSATPPVEEQLRQLSAQQNNALAPAALYQQTEMHLQQVLSRYALLQDRQGGAAQ